VTLMVASQCLGYFGEGVSGKEAAERDHRVGGLILSRLFVGSLGAGTRPPINLDGNG
jgi:hypothetical protein